ncbi:porin [Muribacter muris]|uniref:Porin n=1 Tax=Muribacter muris TaxID=67855 RepID=A0A4Y9JV50_9PAST|nr:porin [Muribacter muris]MBF0785557.1 porin [Muribacter muris]MBF0827128.1 porin [Muribacter muris]TFV09172.1 porin [Muribacter muris]
MKKTLLALTIGAIAANSVQAYTLIDSKESGTTLDFGGSARLQWRSTTTKTDNYANQTTIRQHVNQAVRNNGSRFGFRVKQQLTDDFYALGRVEWRFRGTAASQHDFDDIYTRQLYVGIGHKQFGELTYGHQTVITDEVKQTDLANTLSLSDGLLNYAARRSLQYVYKGVEGLKLGGYYGGSSKRDNLGLDLADKRKDVWGAAAIYRTQFADNQSIKLATGVSRERYGKGNVTVEATAYSVGAAYTFDKTTIGLDLERRVTRNQNLAGSKRVQKEVRTILLQKLTDDWAAYTMYAYKTNALKGGNHAKTHQFMLGTEYYLVPQHLKTFVEWQTARTKNHTSDQLASKIRHNQTVIGLRAYW